MKLPTEPIGSIPRPDELIDAIAGKPDSNPFDVLFERAINDTISQFAQTGSPVITDGEQTKSSFATYPLEGLTNLAPNGVTINFQDGHTRQLPVLTSGPFKYGNYAVKYLDIAK